MNNLIINNTKNIKILLFSIGEKEYCIPILSIREIREFGRVTSLPFSPHYVRGAINLRGTILTIVDLAKYLNIKPQTDNQRRVVIIIESKSGILCSILVDRVINMTDINVNNIQYFYEKK